MSHRLLLLGATDLVSFALYGDVLHSHIKRQNAEPVELLFWSSSPTFPMVEAMSAKVYPFLKTRGLDPFTVSAYLPKRQRDTIMQRWSVGPLHPIQFGRARGQGPHGLPRSFYTQFPDIRQAVHAWILWQRALALLWQECGPPEPVNAYSHVLSV